MSVVFVSVDGGGGGCFISSCGWCAMFFFELVDFCWLRMNLRIIFFFGSLLPSSFVSDRSTSLLLAYEKKTLACEFSEDCVGV